jgi:hypothetical protein
MLKTVVPKVLLPSQWAAMRVRTLEASSMGPLRKCVLGITLRTPPTGG